MRRADGSGLTEVQLAARERLSAYVRQVQDAASAAPARAYQPERLAVLAEPYGSASALDGQPDGPADVSAADVAWPGPALHTGQCLVVTGAQAEAVLSAASTASVETRWRVGGEARRIALRPMLPHEQTCDDAQEQVVPPTA